MNDPGNNSRNDRGAIWMRSLVTEAEFQAATQRHGILWCDALLNGNPVRYIAVVSDPSNAFPRARGGEMGLLQGWTLAACVRELVAGDQDPERRPVIALVDVPSQAYGRREEALCISLALAAAVDAFASARMAGHPSVALIVGNALSGGFLAHGYQASRILALDTPSVQIHAMGKLAATRITRRTLDELEDATREIAPMSYDLHAFASLEILHELIACEDPDRPSSRDVQLTSSRLEAAIALARHDGPHLAPRGGTAVTGSTRALSYAVRVRMQEGWSAATQAAEKCAAATSEAQEDV